MRTSLLSTLFTVALGFALMSCGKPAPCVFFPEACFGGFTDEDQDGFMAELDDCNDQDPAVNPAAPEEQCDGLDNDCDGYMYDGRGGTYGDADGDGYGDPDVFYDACDTDSPGVPNMDDCDDGDADVHPGADESTENFVDDDCDGEADEDVLPIIDADHDGFPSSEDCDDANAQVNPDAVEVCDSVDNDCDGFTDDADSDVTDQETWYADADQDGYGTDQTVTACFEPTGYAPETEDCNDANPDIRPGADEWDCQDPTDYNCDGVTGFADTDQDGYPACEECDDLDMTSHPGAEELCDGADNDCNGIIDDAATVVDPSTFYADLDGDGYGDLTRSVMDCNAPSGYVSDATDCDDSKTLVHPGGTEVCDAGSVDEDCDGTVNDADPSATGKLTWYRDADADGSGGSSTVSACVAPSGYVAQPGDCLDSDPAYHPGAPETDCSDPADYNCDGITGFADGDNDGFAACEECDDGNAAIHPGATEVCDGKDNNCNGTVDGSTEATNKSTYYPDADADGYGKNIGAVQACSAPSGYVSITGDCDDNKVGVNPAASEACNGWDDDCDSLVDDTDSGVAGRSTFYRDADTDGYGAVATTKQSCVQPSGYVANSTDCNDSVSAINPTATEICDSKDNDCDGFTDDQDTTVSGRPTWYADADTDGYGNVNVTKASCVQPSGYVTVSTDCNDAVNAIHPTATEVCNGLDDNCVSGVDEGVKLTFYQDTDGDGYGNGSAPTQACSAPSSYVVNSTDCNDSASAVHPGATEVCNGLDDNCTAGVDEGLTSNYYRDADSDGFGKSSDSKAACSQPSGYVVNSTDCDDISAAVNPLAAEICDGLDNDCDSQVDEGFSPTTWYADADGDGYRNVSVTKVACSQPSGYTTSAAGTDCNDGNLYAHSTTDPEACDNQDNDCDNLVDEGLSSSTWYRDADLDTYGTPLDTKSACAQPIGYIGLTVADCDDTRASVHPTADEVCSNGRDDDCDLGVDENPCIP